MIFEATQRTPLVEIESDRCLVRGECYPENISEWADPVMQALDEELNQSEGGFTVDVELYYFNSSSAKFLFDFFDFLEGASEGGRKITINWRYRSDDDTMQEAGEDFEEDLSHCCYNLVVI